MLGFAPLSTLPFGATPAPPGPYVRPAAAAANISFDGAVYTSPAYNAADLTFQASGAKQVTAIPPAANFGVPLAAYARTVVATVATPSTVLGTPRYGITVAAATAGQITKYGVPPYFGPTVFQTFGRGADGETVFLDDSPYYATITRNGSIAKSTAQSRFGSGSIALTGASTANNLTVGPHTRYNVGSGPFTIEAEGSLNAYNANGGRLIGAGAGGDAWNAIGGFHWLLQEEAAGVSFTWLWYGLQSTYWGYYTRSVSAPLALSTWTQIKVTYDGSTVRLFVDGVLASSLTGYPLSLYGGNSSTPIGICVGSMYGSSDGATNAANAYLQDVRVRRDCTNVTNFDAPTEGLKGWLGEISARQPTTSIPTPGQRRSQPVPGTLVSSFGTGFGANYQRPTGFTTTEFGPARIFPYSPPPVVSALFGSARLFPFHVAPGIRAVVSDLIFGQQYWTVPWAAPRSVFGVPTTPTNRSAAASGTAAAVFGIPFSSMVASGGDGVIWSAGGRKATKLGLPSAQWRQAGTATPISSVHHGQAHRAHMAYWVSSVLADVAVGTARVGSGRHQITGSKSVHAGWPLAIMTLHASALQPKYKTGAPKALRPGASIVYGFTSSWFGHPTGHLRRNYRPTSCHSTTIGQPDCRQRHWVTQIAPGTKLPAPLLKRITQC